MKKINTNKDRLENLEKRGNLIKESFQEQFNKIKRLNEDWGDTEEFDDFQKRKPYIDSNNKTVGLHSDNTLAGAKLAYNELREAGAPVRENRSHSSDPTIFFILDGEIEGSGEWFSYPTISNFVKETLLKYRLYGDWADGSTVEVRSID